MNKLLKVLQTIRPTHLQQFTNNRRTFLSQAYNCTDVWNQRTGSQILSQVNVDDLYYELDQRYQKAGLISAVDVDIYANKIQDDQHVDELLDLVHKLRLSSETSNTLNSTPHAVIRYLLAHNKTTELLNVLDDRLNYGLFLDYYTANILMDHFFKQKDFVAGVRVASQMMLQEECNHPITKSYALLHCYKYLCDPKGWPEQVKIEEPEDEVKIRVKFLRNPFDDQHFDLRNDLKIVGKTLMAFTQDSQAKIILDRSLHVVGCILFEKELDQALLKDDLYEDVLRLLPAEHAKKAELASVFKQSGDVGKVLEENVVAAEKEAAAEDIKQQIQIYEAWENERKSSLDQQIERLQTAKRIENIEETHKDLKTREEKLWFFENQEQIELNIENKKVYYPKRWFGKKKKPRKIDEGYVPPEL